MLLLRGNCWLFAFIKLDRMLSLRSFEFELMVEITLSGAGSLFFLYMVSADKLRLISPSLSIGLLKCFCLNSCDCKVFSVADLLFGVLSLTVGYNSSPLGESIVFAVE